MQRKVGSVPARAAPALSPAPAPPAPRPVPPRVVRRGRRAPLGRSRTRPARAPWRLPSLRRHSQRSPPLVASFSRRASLRGRRVPPNQSTSLAPADPASWTLGSRSAPSGRRPHRAPGGGRGPRAGTSAPGGRRAGSAVPGGAAPAPGGGAVVRGRPLAPRAPAAAGPPPPPPPLPPPSSAGKVGGGGGGVCVCAREGGSREESPGAAAASETLRAAGAAGPHLHRSPPPLRGREQRGGAEARGRARGRAGSRRGQTLSAEEEVVGAPPSPPRWSVPQSFHPRVLLGPEPGRCCGLAAFSRQEAARAPCRGLPGRSPALPALRWFGFSGDSRLISAAS